MEDKRNSTLEEILEEDSAAIKRKGKRKGCLVRMLLLLTVLFLFFFGLLYIVQYTTDLEAEARVSAILTASANANPEAEVSNATPEGSAEEGTSEILIEAAPTETPEIITATPDTDLARTATIAAQLTSVAEFQETTTPAD